jgi:hypothetical protein
MRSPKRFFSVVSATALLLLALAVPVSAAKATATLTLTACAPNGGPNLDVTVSWSGVNVNAWSAAVLADDHGGIWDYGAGYYLPLPKTVSSGSETETFTATTAYDGAQAVFAIGYIYMGSSTNIQTAKGFPAGTGGLNKPTTGWPTC